MEEFKIIKTHCLDCGDTVEYKLMENGSEVGINCTVVIDINSGVSIGCICERCDADRRICDIYQQTPLDEITRH